MYSFKEGDIVTRTNGPYKGLPLKVVGVYSDLDGNERVSCIYDGGKDPVNIRGVRRSFQFHKDYVGNAYDKSFKLTPCWLYMCSKYEKSSREGDTVKQLYDWHHIRGLACHLNDCSKVEDIPDENLKKTREFCNKMIDLYFEF